MRMNPRNTVTAARVLIATAAPFAAAVPPHPDQIEFPPLQFDPPQAADFRQSLFDRRAGGSGM